MKGVIICLFFLLLSLVFVFCCMLMLLFTVVGCCRKTCCYCCRYSCWFCRGLFPRTICCCCNLMTLLLLLFKAQQCMQVLNKKLYCYTSQIKYVFRLDENATPVVGQNSLTPQVSNNLNFRPARDQVVLLETAGKVSFVSPLPQSWGPHGKKKKKKTHCFPWGQSSSAYIPSYIVKLDKLQSCERRSCLIERWISMEI